MAISVSPAQFELYQLYRQVTDEVSLESLINDLADDASEAEQDGVFLKEASGNGSSVVLERSGGTGLTQKGLAAQLIGAYQIAVERLGESATDAELYAEMRVILHPRKAVYADRSLVCLPA